MTEKTINPVVKSVLELGPTLVFFVIYLRLKEQSFTFFGQTYSGFIVAALIFIPILLASMAILWALTRKIGRMQVLTAVLVIVFGGLTAWFNDESFFKMKTTIVYGLLSATLAVGLLQGKSYLQWVMGEMMPMRHEGWMMLTKRLCVGFAVLAVANEVVWRTMSTDLWVKLETFAFPAALFVFLWLQIASLQRYMIDPEKPAK
ncbi:inner membrane-spanning protein YciB [Neotabrizicola shimadae]|uniref:Inner membrane-spanning protein YciB n=1 Tax=Neotabrizicola shimadae TaxID=2807096 RepID=A0A8G0ZN44_9RHOB|nr:inner membrane-spanning protein YciB [Neotabrizicola shimadae]QYZ68401.1 septation protein IspZ [Neotabrizicola shimadae]